MLYVPSTATVQSFGAPYSQKEVKVGQPVSCRTPVLCSLDIKPTCLVSDIKEKFQILSTLASLGLMRKQHFF